MNERIRELAKLADSGYTGNSEDGLGASLVGNHAIEKFAELIIEECARKCDVVREYYGGDKQFGARLCADEIRYLNRRS
jgi:hypothetical protein